MNKDSLFVYEEDGFCELKYTFKDLRRLERENTKLQQENEKLNHYKLLYQKVKERNEKAVAYIEDRYDPEQKVCVNTFDKCNVGELLEILDNVKGDEE